MSCSGRPGAQHHGVAVAGLGVRAGAGDVGAAVAAGGEDGHLRREAMDGAVVEIERDDAAAAAVLVHDQVDGEIFDEELGRMAQRLAVQGVQHGVAGAVGGGAGALRDALAVMRGHAAERALIDLAVFACARTAGPNAPARTPPAGALRHIYSMASWSPSQSDPLTVSYMCQRQSSSPMLPSAAAMPPCAATVCERVGNTLVMQAVRKPGLAAADHGAQPGAAGADHDDVVGVVFDRISAAIDGRGAAPPLRSVIRPCSQLQTTA